MEFAVKFASKLSACLGREVHYYRFGPKNAWFVRVGNAELYFLIQDIRRNPAIIRKLVHEVGSTRGWVELIEGRVKIIREKVRRTPKVCIDFCNTDPRLLEIISEASLAGLGIRLRSSVQQVAPPRKTAYHLRIYRKDGVRKFLNMVPTTKLTNQKKPIAERWVTKRIRRESPI